MIYIISNHIVAPPPLQRCSAFTISGLCWSWYTRLPTQVILGSKVMWGGKHSFRHARRKLKHQWKKRCEDENLRWKKNPPGSKGIFGGKRWNTRRRRKAEKPAQGAQLLHLQFFPSLANRQCEMERERISRSYLTLSVEKHGLVQDPKENQLIQQSKVTFVSAVCVFVCVITRLYCDVCGVGAKRTFDCSRSASI